MRSTPDIVEDVLEWVGATLPEIQSLSDYPVTENPNAYPDCAVEVRAINETPRPPGNFPATAHPRGSARTLDLALSILVEPLPARDAAQGLWTMADRLIAARRADRTLGASLHSTPILCAVPGLVTLSDGSAAMSLLVTFSVSIIDP